MLQGLVQDFHFAGRAMRRAPAVPVMAVVTLAFGVGASVAVFTVADGVLLQPLPFDRPEQIMLVYPTIEEWRTDPSLAANADRGRFSEGELAQWLERQQSFSSAAGIGGGSARIMTGAGAERVAVAHGTRSLFGTLGVRPLLGRLFDESAPETEPVVVLTHRHWMTHHGGDRGIVGRDIVMNDAPVRVIGVLPQEFELTGVDAAMYRPMEMSPAGQMNSHSYRAVGRLRDDVTREAAEAESAALLAAFTAATADHDITHQARLVAPVTEVTKPLRTPLLILAGACLLLLVSACANVALLLLGAGADRVRELAVRRALGADRRRIARQLLTESVVLSSAGALAGLGVAAAVIRGLLLVAPEGLPRIEHVAIDPRTYVAAALLALVTGVVVGCVPALSLSGVQATSALRSGATAPGRGRLQGAIVVLQLALATVLLVGAGLLTRTMQELQQVQPGFQADGLATIEIALPYDRLRGQDEDWAAAAPRMTTYVSTLHAALATVPGVDALTSTSDMPFSGDRSTHSIEVEGYTPPPGEEAYVARRTVAGNYFDVMQIPLLQGRALSDADALPGAEPVMVVTDRLARKYWGDARWLDRRITWADEQYRVVGIVADMREHDLRGDEDQLKFYVAARDAADAGDNIIVRSSLPPETLLPLLRERIWQTDPNIIVTNMGSMRERISGSIAAYRYRMRLMLAFSLIAAAFCLLGIYGVMSRAVARRRQELGIRVALGAQRGRILALVLRDGLRLGVAGALLGLGCAWIATRALESMLWGVPATDPLTFGVIAGMLLLLALGASLLPARRAAALQPMTSLRG